MWRGDVKGMREIIESDFFVRKRIDKRINWFGIWWLRFITKNFKEFEEKYQISRNVFQYEYETSNFGQYFDVKLNQIINIWIGYDYSEIVNTMVLNKNNFFIAVSYSNFCVDGYTKVKRYRRTGYTTIENKSSEIWYYKNISKINKKRVQNELCTVIETINKTQEGEK
jgi:hypothetical protein